MSDGLVRASAAPGAVASPQPQDQAFQPPVPEEQRLDRPLAAIRRYKWLIAAVVLTAAGLGIAGSRLITPQYEVRATVWIAGSDDNNRTGPIRSGELLNSSAWI